VPPLLVVDGDSLGHRAYHAMPPIKGAGGQPVGLLLGFANMLLATYEVVQPRAVLVCLDARSPSYRHELLPGYQGQRPEFPDDLRSQLDTLPELAGAFGFHAAKEEPWEADDLLASAVEDEESRGGQALVFTSDRDSFQLVSAHTSVLMPGKPGDGPTRVGRDEVVERYGVEPGQVIDLIALRGDPSDNIPGAKGVGPKTAAELLRRYGSLEGVIAAAGELTPRQREAIGEHADELRSYRDVATMRRDVPLPDLADRPFDQASAAEWSFERGITGLAKRLSPAP
jgi:DNA polymerase-1